jgi:hypothetical protein
MADGDRLDQERSTGAAGGQSRRAVLAASLGGVGAWIASAIGGAAGVRAADGDTVKVGGTFDGASTTTMRVSTPGFSALWGHATATTGGGVGVRGDSPSQSGIGVWGNSSSTGVKGTGPLGVWGVGSGGNSAGVYGTGVEGVVGNGTIIGVRATSASIALQVEGRARFTDSSGVATVPAGRTKVTVIPGVDVSPTAFVLLTPRVDLGGRDLWFTVDSAAGKITIRLSSARSSATPIAWLLLG